MSIKRSILIRVRIAFLVILVIGVAIGWKIFDIQFFSGDKWHQSNIEQRIKSRHIEATRGNIYAADGKSLATSTPEYYLRFDTQAPKKDTLDEYRDTLGVLLSRLFGDKSARDYRIEIMKASEKKKRYVKLGNRRIKHHEKSFVETWPLFRKGQMRGGIIFEKTDERQKPFRMLAKRTIGDYNYTKKRGKYGIEFSFQEELKGKDGYQIQEHIINEGWIPLEEDLKQRPVHGLDVYTTIDVNIQDVAERALENAIISNEANNGCVVVMEVKTGEIKAIANLTRHKNGKCYEELNYAVAKSVNPGSTFKLASAMALMDERGVRPTDSLNTGNGKHKFYNTWLRDSHYGGFGTINMHEAFEKSSNIYFARMVDSLFNRTVDDREDFMSALHNYGLLDPLNFQLKGEATPKLPQVRSGLTLPWTSIGYSIELSPLQVLAFYNGVANDGNMVRPMLVKYTKKAGAIVEEFKLTPIQRKLCKPETLKHLQAMLEGVVSRGTAENIKNPDYKIAGKTGTCQKYQDGHYLTDQFYTSFAGYFPADAPKYSCIVVIDNPKLNQYGSSSAAPVFKEIADHIYAQDVSMQPAIVLKEVDEKNVYPVMQAGYYDEMIYLSERLGVPYVRSDSTTQLVKAKIANGKIAWNNRPVKSGEAPDVIGMTLRDALPALENNQLRVKILGAGHGRVIKQSPAPGSSMAIRSTIAIWCE